MYYIIVLNITLKKTSDSNVGIIDHESNQDVNYCTDCFVFNFT